MHISFLLLLLLQPAQQASVRGHVTAAEGGAPVKQADVVLKSTRGPNLRKTETDPQGAFEFRDVEPGTYTLTFSKPGFVVWNYGQTDIQSSAVVRVGAGEQAEGIDFRAIRTSVISGTVTGEDGEPLRSMSVFALVKTYRAGMAEMGSSKTSTTDDRGQYRLFDLEPGRYYVQAMPPARPPLASGESRLAPVFYRSGASAENAEAVQVAAGAEVAHIDLVMRRVRGYMVSGRILDASTGQPPVAGSVNITPFPNGPSGAAGPGSTSPIGQDGTFQVSGVLPGKVRLSGSIPIDSRPVMFVRWLDVSSDLPGLTVNVYRQAPVRGRVISDGAERPADLRVWISDRNGRTAGFSGDASVEKDGTFVVYGLQPGDYDIMVRRASTERLLFPVDKFYVREVRGAGKELLDQVLSVPENFAIPELEIVIDFHGGTVTGTVVNDDGTPLPGTMAVLVSPDAKKRTSESGHRMISTVTSGKYTFNGVTPGESRIVAWPSVTYWRYYWLRDPEIYQSVEKHTTHLTVEKDTTIVQDLRLLPAVRAVARSLR